MAIQPDKALTQTSGDDYSFSPVAAHVAGSIARIPSTEGLVVGIEGEWGSGKTSFANFIVAHLEKGQPRPLIVRYNAWGAVDESDAAMGLLSEVRGALSREIKAVKEQKGERSTKWELFKSKALEVDKLLERFNVDAVSESAKFGRTLLQNFLGTGSLEQLKTGVHQALQLLDRRLYVFVDDLDRMAAQHLRVLFATIKTVCDVPGLVFLVALDKQVVANALAQVQGGDGMAYLDKIVSLSVPVPYIDQESLVRKLHRHFVSDLEVHPEVLKSKEWIGLEADGVRRFLRKPRDVIRLCNALSMTYPEIRDEVNVEEFVALEALRLFEPTVHSRIKDIPQYLTAYDSDDAKASVKALYDLGSPEGRPQRMRTLARLFPDISSEPASARRFTNAKSVSNPAKFAVYFQFGLIPGALTEGEYARALAAIRSGADEFTKYVGEAAAQPIRGTHSVVERTLERLLNRWPEEFWFHEPLTIVTGVAGLTDAQVLRAESSSSEYSLRTLTRQFARFAVHRLKAASVHLLPERLRKARSVLMMQSILAAVQEELGEIYEDDFKAEVEKAIVELKAIYAALCVQQAATGELWNCPSLPSLLEDLVSATSIETARRELATSQPGIEQSLQIVDAFFESTPANDNDPRYGAEHAWKAIDALRRFFPENHFDALLTYSGQAPKWLAAFRKQRQSQIGHAATLEKDLERLRETMKGTSLKL
jgi:hypothetical protein